MTQQAQAVPQEPTHPDFEKIESVIAHGLDAAIQDGGERFDLPAYAKTYVDPQSISFVAMKRVIGLNFFPYEGVEEFAQQLPMIMNLSMAYVEAFLIGMQFQQVRAENDDAVAAGILRKLVTTEGYELDLDGKVTLTPLEQAVLGDLSGS